MNDLLGRDPHPLLLVAAWSAIGITGLLLLLLARGNRPRKPAPGPETMDLRPETPAVVDLLTGDFLVSREAVPATLLDLAARRWVELEQVGGDTVLRIPGTPGRGELTPYEKRVLAHVRGLALDGLVPAAALTTGPEDASERWWNRFRSEVIEDARLRGLCVRRWPLGQLVLLWAGVGVSALLLRLAVAVGEPRGAVVGPAQRRLEAGDLTTLASYVFLLGVAATVALGWILLRHTRSEQQRDTPEGLAAAARWLGVRRHLAERGEFSDKPAASVVLWDRLLGYAAAMGLASAAVRQLPLGAEDDRRAWSRATGTWRRVRVTYPRLRPGWGEHPFRALVASLTRGVVVGVLAWFTLLAAGGHLEALRDLPSEVQLWIARLGPIVVALLLPVLAWQATVAVMAVLDLFGRRRVRGVLVRKRRFTSGARLPGPVRWLWRNRREPHSGMRVRVKVRSYVAVDTGKTDRIAAWKVDPRVFGQAPQGAEVVARVTPLLGHVKSLEMISPPPVRDAPISMAEAVAEAAGPAGALVNPLLEGLASRMDRLEGVVDEEGRPLLDQTDEEGVPLRRRLEEAGRMLGGVRGERPDMPH